MALLNRLPEWRRVYADATAVVYHAPPRSSRISAVRSADPNPDCSGFKTRRSDVALQHDPRQIGGAPESQTAKRRTSARASQVVDRPWIFRTYAGHSTPKASNELYRKNLSKGQTGPSVAFDLPTQTGYDATIRWPRARSERSAFPSRISATCARCSTASRWQMNTSMTINATARVAAGALHRRRESRARDRKAARARCRTTSSRNIFARHLRVPPAPSMRLIKDIIVFTTAKCRNGIR